MAHSTRLPLFPLNTVLFPGQILPLHIFEPRYRLMISHCIKNNLPFGVVLIRTGRESGEPAEPHRVGTLARIIEAKQLEDGRFNIITVGESRFRILNLYDDQPYLTGDIAAWPWNMDDVSFLSLPVQEIRQHLRHYLANLARALGNSIKMDDMPSHPITLACLVAIALQVTPHEKQDLLLSPTVSALMDKEISLLQREARLLVITGDVPTRSNDQIEKPPVEN